MNCITEKTQFKPCQIDYRKNEKFWVFGSPEDVAVTFEIQFDNETDQALARVFLLELNTCKKSVMNCPAIAYHDKNMPENVMRVFPDGMKSRTSNGSITLQVSESHLKKGIDQPLS